MLKNILLVGSVGVVSVLAQNRPNVVFIICDDLLNTNNVDGSLPQAKTPNLDRLRSQSVNFTNAQSVAPVSAPARAAMLTGIYPHISSNYGFDTWYNNPILKNCKSLPAFLKENGYNVLGTGKLFHHDRNVDFSEYGHKNYAGPLAWDGVQAAFHPSVPIEFAQIGPLDGTFGSLADIPNVKSSSTAPGYNGWWDTQKNKAFRYVNDNDRDLMRDEEHKNWAIEQINKQNAAKPYFLGVGFSKPHTALVAPQKYFDMYPMDQIQLPVKLENDAQDTYLHENTPFSKGYVHYDALKKAYPTNYEYGLKKYLQAYMASVTFVDDLIGEILNAIDNSAEAQNTIVIFTSDHGYDFAEKDYFFKNSLWHNSATIPFLVRYPQQPASAGKSVQYPISLIDIYPTVVDLCKLQGSTKYNENGADLSGYSIKPFLENPSIDNWAGPRAALSIVQNENGSLRPEAHNYSLKSKDWRYIRYANGKEELYNTTQDPYEWHNLADVVENKTIKDDFVDLLTKMIPEFVYNIAPDIDAPNLVLNGGFEEGLKNWTGYGNGTTSEQGEFYSGSKGGIIYGNGAINQEISVEANETYRLSFFARFRNPGSKINYHVQTGEGWTNNLITGSVKSTNFQINNLIFRVPADVTRVRLRFYFNDTVTPANHFMIDQVNLMKLTPTTANTRINNPEHISAHISARQVNDILKYQIKNLKPNEQINVKFFGMDGDELHFVKKGNHQGVVEAQFSIQNIPTGIYFIAVSSMYRHETLKVFIKG